MLGNGLKTLIEMGCMDASPTLRFVAESTLGKLCKLLRMAGCDVVFDESLPEANRLADMAREDGRLVLTRTAEIYKILGPYWAVLITANDAADQIQQVIRACGIKRQHLKPLTRCLRCNCAVETCTSLQVQNEVPEYILQIHTTYHHCPRCGRVYWPGSHARHSLEMISKWFTEESTIG
jgi:uncharacterized protein with PIN domain